MKKKIGVLTFCSSKDNYGQILQCYALQQYLKDGGYDAFLIRYIRKFKFSFQDIMLFDPQKICHLIHHRIKCFLDKENIKLNDELNDKREFGIFKQKYITSTSKCYGSIHELRKEPPQADVYICGSDQLWADDVGPAYYLGFGDVKKKRIAYAVSFGEKKPRPNNNKFRSYISQFDAISCREREGIEICANAGFGQAEVVLDPTLLLRKDDYKKLFDNDVNISKKYIFSYFVNIQNESDVHWDKVNEFSKQECLNVRCCLSQIKSKAEDVINSCPNEYLAIDEWLKAISNATYFVTTSFHGMAFAIIFNVPFLVILPPHSFSKTNERFVSLLSLLGLKDRIYNPDIDMNAQMKANIDWDMVNKSLANLRAKSEDFLSRNLK